MSTVDEEVKHSEIEFDNQDKYVGETINNKMNGRGTYYFANGDVFTGIYENDQPLKGRLNFANQS